MPIVTADYAIVTAPMKIMHSVNNAPVGETTRLCDEMSNHKYFREAGIPYCRNHDAAHSPAYDGEFVVDVHRIFRNFDADVNDPASYYFTPTDKYVAAVDSVGAKTFYRLGASIEHKTKNGTYPPKDFKKWAQICEHIIRHYTEGWADGFHYDMEYWEIWNEAHAISGENNPCCWQGSMELFIEFFITVFSYLKETFPSLKIGGPALCSCYDDKLNHDLFDAMQARGLMLDFYSFHGYNSNPACFIEDGKHAYELLCEYGWENHTELILNEWNYNRGWYGDDYVYSMHAILDKKALKNSSYIAGTMAAGQVSHIDHMMYYDARPTGFNGMFAGTFLTPLKGYYPFAMYGQMYRMGQQVCSKSDDATIFAVAAKGEHEGGIMITYFDDDDDAPSKEVAVNLDNLPAEGLKAIEYYVVDEFNDMKLFRTDKTTAQSLTTYLKFDLYTTCYLKIRLA